MPNGAFASALEQLVREQQASLGRVARNRAIEEEPDSPKPRSPIVGTRRRRQAATRAAAGDVSSGRPSQTRLAKAVQLLRYLGLGSLALAILPVVGGAVVLRRATLELVLPSKRAPHHGLVFLSPIVEGRTEALREELTKARQ